MEALVNIAYDRISEDIILLYDAMRAYNEVGKLNEPDLRVSLEELDVKRHDEGMVNMA